MTPSSALARWPGNLNAGAYLMQCVFIIDDHDIVRFGLSALLSSCPELTLVGAAANLQDGLKGIAQYRPDLVISDLLMDDSRGLDTVRAVVAAQGSRPVLIISMHDELIYAEQVLASGAKGSLMKEKAQQFALSAVLAVLNGQMWVSPAVGTILLSRLKPHPKPMAAATPTCPMPNLAPASSMCWRKSASARPPKRPFLSWASAPARWTFTAPA
jgi:DNA-binding NarL/FixJ family response regulator